jgi:serine protease AprX
MIKADQVWAGEGLITGYDGDGVGVAIMDSGIDGTHPDVKWGENLKPTSPSSANPLGEGGPAQFMRPADRHLYDDHGHGTHVAGTVGGTGVASDGKFTGVAPGSDLYGFKIGSARSFAWYADPGLRLGPDRWAGRPAQRPRHQQLVGWWRRLRLQPG